MSNKKCLLEFDKSGAEWVVVAYAGGDGRMIHTVESGASPHVETGHLITSVERDLIGKEDTLLGHHSDPNIIEDIRRAEIPEIFEQATFLPRSMSCRQAGKKSNHGLNYNMKYKRFALENEMPENDARRMVQLYHQAYPGVGMYQEWVKRQLSDDRTLYTCFGHKRTFRDGWGETLFDSAYSYIPQRTIFELTRQGMVKVYSQEEFNDLELLAQVHDSILTQCTWTNPMDMGHLVHTVGNVWMNPELEYSGRKFHIKTTVKVGVDWGANHMEEVLVIDDIEKMAGQLEQAWEKVNASVQQAA